MERPIDLDWESWEALDRLSRRDGVSLRALVQEAVRREVQRRSRAPKPDQPDEALLSPLRALLADDFAYARGWADLAMRLARKGHGLVPSGAGLVLVALPGGGKVCKASDLGYSHARLARKFGGSFGEEMQGRAGLRQAGQAFIKRQGAFFTPPSAPPKKAGTA